jgi:hypothetical protein
MRQGELVDLFSLVGSTQGPDNAEEEEFSRINRLIDDSMSLLEGAVLISRIWRDDKLVPSSAVIAWPLNNMALEFTLGRSESGGITDATVIALSPGKPFDLVVDFLKRRIHKIVPDKGCIYIMGTDEAGSLALIPAGIASKVLRRANYQEAANKSFDHIVKDLGSKDPCGRIVVLEGPPGTGKTYYLKGILDAAPAMFVFVPSVMVSRLTDPVIFSLLAEKRNYDESVSTVLIIEDADECLLAKSDGGDLSSTSNILNLGDGLLSETLDLRILCTTNAKITKLHEAVTRPGRLCSYVGFGYMSKAEADELYRSLIDNPEELLPEPFDERVTLAEVYRAVRGKGSGSKCEPTTKKTVVGFGPSRITSRVNRDIGPRSTRY